MIARNKLCPCGSGKKYKKCCLQKNQLIEFNRNKTLYAKGLYENMENKIYEYLNSSSFKLYKEKSAKKFKISKERNSIIDNLYNTYLIYDYSDENQNVIAKIFLNKNKSTLNKNQKNVLLSMIKSNISIYKIEYKDDTKMIIRDYFSDDKIIIEDVELFKNLEVDKNIIARPVNIQGMNILIDGYITISNKNIKIILEDIEQLYKNNHKKYKNIKEFLIYNSDIIYKFAQQIVLNDKDYIIKPLKNNNINVDEVESINNNLSIYNVLKNNMEEKYLQKGLSLWKQFVKCNKSIKGSENGWAAAVEYYVRKNAGEAITQAQVSQKYEVSPRTLGKRYKELRAS
ncbi:SEC-C metal-binding domain-containing protein [Terrisporobacter sp.]